MLCANLMSKLRQVRRSGHNLVSVCVCVCEKTSIMSNSLSLVSMVTRVNLKFPVFQTQRLLFSSFIGLEETPPPLPPFTCASRCVRYLLETKVTQICMPQYVESSSSCSSLTVKEGSCSAAMVLLAPPGRDSSPALRWSGAGGGASTERAGNTSGTANPLPRCSGDGAPPEGEVSCSRSDPHTNALTESPRSQSKSPSTN